VRRSFLTELRLLLLLKLILSKTFSGKQVIKILCREFGFKVASQKGSHVKLKKYVHGRKIVTIVPLHTEVSIGTFKDILDLGDVDEHEFRAKP